MTHLVTLSGAEDGVKIAQTWIETVGQGVFDCFELGYSFF